MDTQAYCQCLAYLYRMPETFVLKSSGLEFTHDNTRHWQFNDISLERGQHLLVLGSSGSGKTTLLHLLSGLLKPLSGNIEVKGESLNEKSGSELDAFRGENIGMIFQRPHFIRSLNAMENIELVYKLNNNENSRVDKGLLSHLRIEHLMEKNPGQLSEGEKQRLGIARALANDPVLILADEPTSALDDENCEAVIKLLIEVSAVRHCSLVVVTHDERIKSYFQQTMIISN